MNLRRRLARSLPPIAWRDAELTERRDQINRLRKETGRLEAQTTQLEAQTTRLEAQTTRLRAENAGLVSQVQRLEKDLEGKVDLRDYLARPSFRRQLITLRRTSTDLRTLDPGLHHPLRHLPFKLRNYRLAASHGFAVPEVLATWTEPEQIDLSGLPDAFVLKSDGGAGSHGVLPLHRIGTDSFMTADRERRLTADEIREHFGSRSGQRRISGPFFAEGFLHQSGGGPIPDDIKVYTTYGEVQQVLLRRVDRHGDLSRTRRRYVRADGTDLGALILGENLDPSVPVPIVLPQIVDLAAHLSRAVGLPFVRVDVYDTDQGIVVGELTRGPGGLQMTRADHDEAMGLAWERAAYRLDLDVLAGRPPGVLHGPHHAPNPYPAGHVSRSTAPGPWAPVVRPCEEWCLPAPQDRP